MQSLKITAMKYSDLLDTDDFVALVKKELFSRTNGADSKRNHGVPLDEMEKIYKAISALNLAKKYSNAVTVNENIKKIMTPAAFVDHMLEWAEKCPFSNKFLVNNTDVYSDNGNILEELDVLFSLKKDDWI